MRKILSTRLMVATLAAALLAGCNSADSASDRPTVVVTTNVLGEMVTAALGDLAGDAVEVSVIMPIGADPHEFAPSARQAEAMENADLLVVNGLDFEAGMTDVIANVGASGTRVFSFGEAIAAVACDGTVLAGGDDAGDATDDGSDACPTDALRAAGDPHIWMDPLLMAGAFEVFSTAAAEPLGLDAPQVTAEVQQYVRALRTLDASIGQTLSIIPDERRTLVTNHDSLSYFAARYGFEVIGTIIPSVSTSAEASASGLETLAELIRDGDIPAIFAETTESARLADALADEVGSGVSVVELYTGSLGEPGSGAETYLGFMTIDAERIVAALG